VKFVLATFNPDKRRELEAILAPSGVTLVTLADVPGAVAPEETGATLEENAYIKARAALALTGMPAIAEDTGLEVDALDGGPGVETARYAGPKATYADNVAKLLAELKGIPTERRTARFRTVCVVAYPDGVELMADGTLEGRITERPRGTGGFGYGPVFEVPEAGDRTLAELSDAERNAISHRGRAVSRAAKLITAVGEGERVEK
jgi:XTP/dITP diphosphohydrolase